MPFLSLLTILALCKPREIQKRTDYFDTYSDQDFLDRFRISKKSAKFVLDLIEEQIASPPNRSTVLSPAERLLLTLRFYATGSFPSNSGDLFGVDRSTARKIIALVSYHLASLRPTFILFPETTEEITEVQQQFYNIAKFPKCIGALDCTHMKIESPDGRNRAENFRNRKGYFSFNVQTICDANLKITNIVCRWPGSAHDNTIFENSSIRTRFESNEFKDAVLVGDSVYASKSYLMTPFANPTTEGQKKYNEAHLQTRNAARRCHEEWKRRFPILAIGIRLNYSYVDAIVVGTAVLYNIAKNFGDDVPSVSQSDEQYIGLGQFGTGNLASNSVDPALGAPVEKRNSYVKYFESLGIDEGGDAESDV
ncbi:putative nuclease HARBI1 [Planococcus citri]|uniref:putative nuclease HARBI1 n=1 Tax=Planococcus citri TaxID=170843 RepID=UPI0031F94766